jgi:tyrosyl-tRNA synthetase
MDVDIEIGGNDQTFNMLAGRTLMKEGVLGHESKEKYVLTNKLLTDVTGKKMGKSEGNMITLADAPEDMFGKVMSWTDGMIISGFELCTNVPEKTYKGIYERAMDRKESREGNPMIYKRKLAHQIVEDWYSKEDADKAEDYFDRLFRKHEAPEEMPEFEVSSRHNKLVDLLVLAELVASKSEARRQIEQGAVKVNEEVIEDPEAEIEIQDKGTVIQKGKRFFAKIVCTR